MVSVADFIQLSMCHGDINVTDSYFAGAGDDCLDVHGIHFKVTDKTDNKLKLTFMHSQTHGFNPLRVGDTLTQIDKDSLL